MLANDSRNLLRQRTALAAPDSLTGLIDDADRCRFLGDIQSNVEGHRVAPMCVKAGRESPGSRNHRPPGPSAITGCPHMTLNGSSRLATVLPLPRLEQTSARAAINACS